LTLVTASTLVDQLAGQDEVVAPAEHHARAIVVDTHDDTTQHMVSDPSFEIVREAAPAASTSRKCAGWPRCVVPLHAW
jgi:hypothetical protein